MSNHSRRSELKFTRRDLLRAGAIGAALPPATWVKVARGEPSAQIEHDAAWAAVREEFLLEPGVAYMNNASLGMPPRRVVEAVADGYAAISREPLHGKHDLQNAIAEQTLPSLAGMIGCTADEIALTRNATEALHLQTVGLDLAAGDEVLITTQEHPAGRRPWLFRARRDGIRVREVFIPSPLTSASDVVQRMHDAVGPQTRAIAFCHVTRGGHRYPVKELCAMAREAGLASLVDGAQALGQFPINLHDLGCDAYSASLHKWVLAPAGTGLLFVRRQARSRIRTSFAHDATLESPAIAPPGTADFPLRAAIATAVNWIAELGLERVERRCRYLSNYLKAGLGELEGVTLLSGPEELSCPGSTIFEKAGLDAVAAVELMEAATSTHIDEHQRDGHNAIRISTHVYNTTAEIDRVLEALPDLGA
jgi:selenocysteine lyase/cysteine desulfurase